MAKKQQKTTEVSLESILFACRNTLRGSGGIEKKRDAILGLVFLKFVGDKFDKQREKIKKEYGEDPAFLEDVSFYRADRVFYVGKNSRWSYIVDNAGSTDIAVKLDTAMAELEEQNEPLRGALPQRFYSTYSISKETLKELIDNINRINESQFHEKDLIGRVYEYFLQSFAVSASKEDGEFYTPASIVNLISELIEPYSGVVYDPCCGTGGMFVQSLKFVENHHGRTDRISIVGQEKDPDTWKLAKMNLAIRGITHNLGAKNASTFTDDQHKDKKVDFIMANPPFNLSLKRSGENLISDDYRWAGYGTPPDSNANYAWILHMLSKLDVTNGIAGFLLANGALKPSGIEKDIVKNLVENDKIEAIIVLPRDMFYTTDISVTLWILNNNKNKRTLNGRNLRNRHGEVLFVDLRRWDNQVAEYVIEKGKTKKKVVFAPEQIEHIKSIYHGWQIGDYCDTPELCKSVTKAEIAKQDYVLAPSKYIEFIDHDLEIDYLKEMARIQQEMKEVLKQEKESQTMLEEAFANLGFEISGGANGKN